MCTKHIRTHFKLCATIQPGERMMKCAAFCAQRTSISQAHGYVVRGWGWGWGWVAVPRGVQATPRATDALQTTPNKRWTRAGDTVMGGSGSRGTCCPGCGSGCPAAPACTQSILDTAAAHNHTNRSRSARYCVQVGDAPTGVTRSSGEHTSYTPATHQLTHTAHQDPSSNHHLHFQM
jgi:hypothetical protein